MRERFLHMTELHVPEPGNTRRLGWLEILYDLVVAAVFVQLAMGLREDPDGWDVLSFLGVATVTWLTWVGFTVFASRFSVDDVPHRLLVLGQLFGLGGLAVLAPGIWGDSAGLFALTYAGTRVLLSVLFLRAWHHAEHPKGPLRTVTLGLALGAVIWGLSSVVPAPWIYAVWCLAVGVDVAVALGAPARVMMGSSPLDVQHIADRFSLLTLIMLGSAFSLVLAEGSGQGFSWGSAGVGLAAVAVCGGLWWLYFDDIAISEVREGGVAWLGWACGHLPLQLGAVALGAVAHGMFQLDLSAPAPWAVRWLFAGSLGFSWLALAALASVTTRRAAEVADRARLTLRLSAAAVALALAAASTALPAWAFLALIGALCALHVVADVIMAPRFAVTDRHLRETAARTSVQEMERMRRVQPRIIADSAIRIGAPAELRSDLYFHFMRGSWRALFITLAVVFLVANVFFAALFLLEEGAVANVSGDSFLEAFAFSVQTMGSIGYGVMAPQTSYAHMVVTSEALFSIVFIAVSTGLVFAKASRASSSALFSEVAVVHRQDGVPMLSIRAGNARGSDVVEASVRISAIKEHVSPEGHAMRRLYDLELMRSRSPIFVLSWNIYHRIDENSPIRDCFDGVSAPKDLLGLIVTLTGHDGTYGQTIYSRKMYGPGDIRFNELFTDVISTTDDGRMVVDFRLFHESVVADEGSRLGPDDFGRGLEST